MLPCRATIRGLIESAARAAALQAPRCALHLVQRREQYIWIVWIHSDIDRACMGIFEKHSFPGFSPIEAAIDAAFIVWSIGMAQRSYEDDIRIAGMNEYARNMLCVCQTDVEPGPAPIRALIHSVPIGNVAANAGLPGANIDDVRIRNSHRDCSDRRNR